jgi:hypothetical protein
MNNNPPPHFHVFGSEFSAKFAIADCELLSSKGRIRRRAAPRPRKAQSPSEMK